MECGCILVRLRPTNTFSQLIDYLYFRQHGYYKIKKEEKETRKNEQNMETNEIKQNIMNTMPTEGIRYETHFQYSKWAVDFITFPE